MQRPFQNLQLLWNKKTYGSLLQPKKDNRQNGSRNYGNTKQFGNRNRFANRAQLVDQDEELEDDVMVMKIDGDYGDEDSTHPYYMEGFINGYPFKTMI